MADAHEPMPKPEGPAESPTRLTPSAADSPVSPDPAKPPLTVQELSSAFAEMLGPPQSPAAGSATPPGGSEEVPAAETSALPSDAADDCCPITPRSILEAMLFVGRPSNEPLSRQQVAELVRGVEPDEVDALLKSLKEQYAAERAPYAIVDDDRGCRLTLAAEYRPVRRQYLGRVREARLSQAAVEVLALVAYNQPMPGREVSRLRGRPSGHVLAHLVRRRLLRLERSTERPRTVLYQTTPRFLKLFGLASLDELPQAQELEH